MVKIDTRFLLSSLTYFAAVSKAQFSNSSSEYPSSGPSEPTNGTSLNPTSGYPESNTGLPTNGTTALPTSGVTTEPSYNSTSALPTSGASSLPSNSSSTSLPAGSPTSTPYLHGEYVDNKLHWYVHIPSAFNPWGEISLTGTGEDYTIDEASATSGGEPDTSASISFSGSDLDFSSSSTPRGDGEYIIAYISSGNPGVSSFTSRAHLEISTIDTKRLAKRAVYTYDLEGTIDLNASSSSASSSSNSTSAATGASSGSGPTTIWGYSTVTETISGVVTSYVTYCPLTTESGASGSTGTGLSTTTVTKIKPQGAGSETETGGVTTITTAKSGGDETQTITVSTEIVIVTSGVSTQGSESTSAVVSTFAGAGNKIASGLLFGIFPAFFFLI